MIKDVEAKVEQIEQWSRQGFTQQQIANNLGISLATLKNYKNRSLAISTAIKRGRQVTDYEVENALFKSAVNGDVKAMIFWLKNRRPDKWRERKEADEIKLLEREIQLKEEKISFNEKKSHNKTEENKVITVTLTDENLKIRRDDLTIN